MNQYPELAEFQQKFHSLLLNESDPDLIRDMLLKENKDFENYIKSMDPKIISTAAELIKKWQH